MTSDILNSARLCFNLINQGGKSLWGSFILLLLLDLLTVVFSVGTPWILKLLIDSYNDNASLQVLVWLAFGYGAIWLVSELLLRLRAVFGIKLIEQLKKQASLRFCINTIFKEDLKLSKVSAGAFASRQNQIDYAIPVFVDGLASQILPLLVRLMLSVGILIQFVPIIYSVILIVVVTSFAVISYFTFPLIGDRQRLSNNATQATFALMLDVLRNREVILSHGEHCSELNNIQEHLDKTKRSKVNATITEQAISAGQVALLGIGLIMVTALSASDLFKSTISLGDFIQINAYLLQFVVPISYFGMVISGIKRASVTLSDNQHLLNAYFLKQSPSSRSKEHCLPPSIGVESLCVNDIGGMPILRDVSFAIAGGACLAITGDSGAGKSTLMKVLVGLHGAHSGNVLFNSVGLKSKSLKSFRDILGYVPQEHLLLERSVVDNIYNKDSSNIKEALHFYQLSGMPSLYDVDGTPRMTASLSVGEKQRVSMARAIARNPALLLLDEPTNSLDGHSKKIVSDYLFGTLSRKVTRIVITHDLQEAKRADWILVLREGMLVEQGTHSSLLLSEGWYHQQWSTQPITADQ